MKPHMPVKLGSTNGFVHWKIDEHRLQGFINAETNKLEFGRYAAIMKQARKMGMLS